MLDRNQILALSKKSMESIRSSFDTVSSALNQSKIRVNFLVDGDLNYDIRFMGNSEYCGKDFHLACNKYEELVNSKIE